MDHNLDLETLNRVRVNLLAVIENAPDEYMNGLRIALGLVVRMHVFEKARGELQAALAEFDGAINTEEVRAEIALRAVDITGAASAFHSAMDEAETEARSKTQELEDTSRKLKDGAQHVSEKPVGHRVFDPAVYGEKVAEWLDNSNHYTL
jgi:hypothetical protein